MNNLMMIAIVPSGYANKVIRAANGAGASGATILHARGADSSKNESLFSFKVEPEEEIILITATKEVTDEVCTKIHEEFEKDCARSGSVYILPAL